jgi:hypothetical protein
MNQNSPQESVRTLAEFAVVIFEIAWTGAHQVMEHFRPLVEPPRGLRILGGNGAQYSGLLVIDRGSIIAGIVVQTGHDAVAAAGELGHPRQAPYDDHVSRHRHDSSRLPSWADDPRQGYDDDGSPWRR